MKKGISVLLVFLLIGLLAVPATAASEEPVITMQPQSPNYPDYSVAIYTVKASGSNLTATWYMQWEGNTYTISSVGGDMQPWEAYAGELYGAKKVDENTFVFVFEGIERQLNGAVIWCVIEDGHYSVTSQKAYINLGNPATPPEILSIPAQITVEQGQEAEIRCVARSNDETQLGYTWYETETGELPDIRALDRGTEFGDFIICDTSAVGTRYYVCSVNTSNGGIAYSSVVPVTVTQKTEVTEPTQPPTEQPTEADTTPTEGENTAPTVAATVPQDGEDGGDGGSAKGGVDLWIVILIGVAAAAAGVGAALLLVKKKS